MKNKTITQITRSIVFIAFAICPFGETDHVAAIMWLMIAMIFYAICRIEDIAEKLKS